MRVKRALLSVSDKTGLIDFARGLSALGVTLISTGGTAKALRDAGLAVTDVADVTGFPEMMDGRVKTLHPAIHAGILARRDRPDDLETLARQGFAPIDLVCVNLYPFADTTARLGVTLAEAREWIDVGGPTMLRAAAKNFPDVVVVPGPEHYEDVLRALRETGDVSPQMRQELACETFFHLSVYDRVIANYLGVKDGEPHRRPLRYGENPHQRAVIDGFGPGRVLGGKELSYNNLVDVDAAIALAEDLQVACGQEFRASACVIKHATPCGAAFGADAGAAFKRAYDADSESAFGGIVGIGVTVDEQCARMMTESGIFLECIIAPAFTPEAVQTLTTRPKWGKSVRLLDARPFDRATMTGRAIRGGLIWQVPDMEVPRADSLAVKAGGALDPAIARDLAFALTVAKHARSNAIVIAKDGATLGIGAGQTSRVEAVRQAISRAGVHSAGAVLAGDAFFPFPDSIEIAAKAGIVAIAAPSGSKRDDEVIAAAQRLGIALAFTPHRHFRH